MRQTFSFHAPRSCFHARFRHSRRVVLSHIALVLASATLHAAGPVFSTALTGSGQDFALAVTSDAQGNTYVAGLTYSSDFTVTPQAYQSRFGGTCDAFVAKLSRDGKVIWSTYLGGVLDDWATGVAVDRAGNVLIAGYTRSPNFPLVNPIQSSLDQSLSDNYDAFVAKFDPDGGKLLYSTFLGAIGVDGANGLAVDAAGNAYAPITVQSAAGFPGVAGASIPASNTGGIVVAKLTPQGALVYSYFHPYGAASGIALDSAGSAYVVGTAYANNPSSATASFGPGGSLEAMVFKISPDGERKIFESMIGGSLQTSATAVAVDSAGAVYLGGYTSSADFPLVHPLQNSLGARPIWKSADGGVTWTPLDNLPFAAPQHLVADPSGILYAATQELGVFKSVDGGVSWTSASRGLGEKEVYTLVIDPVHPQTLYAAVTPSNVPPPGIPASVIYKTVDGANTWMQIDASASSTVQLAVDPANPSIVYEVAGSIRKSTDGGSTWNAVTFPGGVGALALDPQASGVILASSNPVFCGFFCGSNQPAYLYRSADGGASWNQLSVTQPQLNPGGVAFDASTNPATAYDALAFRSSDAGATWTPITGPPGGVPGATPFSIDSVGTIYATVSGKGNFVSHDRAGTWAPLGSFIPPFTYEAAGPSITNFVPSGGMLYAFTNQISTSGFVAKLAPDGSSLIYSTYQGGHASMESFQDFAAEPGEMLQQNWIAAIAVDASGNATIAGGTRAADFPLANPAQPTNAGLGDAFAATLSADGAALNYATYFGGSRDDGALAAAVDPHGAILIAGQTWSADFPIPGGFTGPTGYSEAFIAKLAPPRPAPPRPRLQ